MSNAEVDLRALPPDGVVPFRCPICASAGPKNRYVAQEMVNGTREPFDYLLCGECGTLFLAHPPEDIGKYYVSYYSTDSQNSAGFIASSPSVPTRAVERVKEIFKRWMCRYALGHPGPWAERVLNRWVRLPPYVGFSSLHTLGLRADAAILDVGCGGGQIVEMLDRLGFTNVRGIDPFIHREVTFRHGATLARMELKDQAGQWDLIMLHHCFEHVPDPVATARLIDEKLKPGGRCLLRFPNVDSVEFTRYGGNWWDLHAPRHFFLLSRKGMETVFAKTALKIQQVWCDSQPDHYFYSREYSLGIADNDPRSYRATSEIRPHPLWTDFEREQIARNVPLYNEQLIGDWIVYVLQKKG